MKERQIKRAVLTVATGKQIYWRMAMELARSFEYWNRESDIDLVVLTDLDEELPAVLQRTTVQRVPFGALGRGFSCKLHLDRFAPAEQTLFVDADCLCVAPIDFVFERFLGHQVSIVGGQISTGEWFGDVAKTCAQVGVSSLPKFNGGIYYLEPGAKASAVYERARALEPSYDHLGLVRLRGCPNDELLMAMAMALEGCVGVPEDGTIMGEFISCPEIVDIDIALGRCVMRNPSPPDPRHRAAFPLEEVRPAIVHFLGSHVTGWLYRSEVLKLRLTFDRGWTPWAASLVGRLYCMPFRMVDGYKNIFRPMFHSLFGPRALRAGAR